LLLRIRVDTHNATKVAFQNKGLQIPSVILILSDYTHPPHRSGLMLPKVKLEGAKANPLPLLLYYLDYGNRERFKRETLFYRLE
jgi:hypothetical protein